MALPDKYWLLCGLSLERLPRAALDEMLGQAARAGALALCSRPRTKADCARLLRRARQSTYDQTAARRQTAGGALQSAAPVSVCEIPASKVNAWLRALPPEGLDP
ncbi:hypothetical protein [Salipiger abyssi]|uniref:hypothetical protein n=1 Tax=Salipiger abyssi TaxID=1250539 RepID=UPI001A8EECC0|nr:hypothetical protein [Salipiger abyssi]MBN9890106.1 hypothetical protein [Salipiger abyssi]